MIVFVIGLWLFWVPTITVYNIYSLAYYRPIDIRELSLIVTQYQAGILVVQGIGLCLMIVGGCSASGRSKTPE